MNAEETRRISGAIFLNDKWAEVIVALDELGGTPLASEIARQIGGGVTSDLITAVLARMETAGLVKAHPRIGNPHRGAQPWEAQPGDRWNLVLALCRDIKGVPK